MAALKCFLLLCVVHTALAKGSKPVVDCTPEVMKVTIPMDGDRVRAYLEGLKDYPMCQPVAQDQALVFMVDLQDDHSCTVMRITNVQNGVSKFYAYISIETKSGENELVEARCVKPGKRKARDVPFPLDEFDEPDVLNITRNAVGNAPEPVLGAVVKQNGKQVSGEISVTPGTPLSMEIFLNDVSAPVYGLLVNYMHVTDTGKQQETIILNGCSVDPYLFDNFLTTDGDVLTAKFRAFKFPDSTYVQFKGTVTVCLDKCQGVQCSNGVIGYGRRRRAISPDSNSNKLYEVSLTTFIKVANKNGDTEAEDVLTLIKNLKIANQKLGDRDGSPATVAEQTQHNTLVLVEEKPMSHAQPGAVASVALLVASFAVLLFK